jgi:bifunctional DNA-binding transcriptional regulator/antitoxin component of YhaV-PrlF toxin-antitoxin module
MVVVETPLKVYKTTVKTMLNEQGQIGIPDEIRRTDHLATGDSFELERLTAGNYLLRKHIQNGARFNVVTSEDGLPLIRAESGVITSQLVKDIENEAW